MKKRYAGFWIRFLAFIIDTVILAVIARLLFGPQASQFAIHAGEGGKIGFNFNVMFAGPHMIIPIAYYLGFWVWKSATPGKLALGLKIIQQNGKDISWQKAILRYIGYILSVLPLCLGFLWIGFSKKKIGFHDMIAKTYVIHKK